MPRIFKKQTNPQTKCPSCDGQGFWPIVVDVHMLDLPRTECSNCRGSGLLLSECTPATPFERQKSK